MQDAPARRPELVALGHAIRGYRVDKAWTQDELAAAAEITRRYLSEIESGRANPSVEVLFALSEALAVKASDVILRAEADTTD